MGLTSEQDLPSQPKPQAEKWSVRRLLSLGSVKNFVKLFNPLELMLGLMVLTTAIAVLVGRELSWGWYYLATIVLIATVGLRYVAFLKEKNKPDKHKI